MFKGFRAFLFEDEEQPTPWNVEVLKGWRKGAAKITSKTTQKRINEFETIIKKHPKNRGDDHQLLYDRFNLHRIKRAGTRKGQSLEDAIANKYPDGTYQLHQSWLSGDASTVGITAHRVAGDGPHVVLVAVGSHKDLTGG